MILSNEPVIVTLNLVNNGSTLEDVPIELTFYADRTYLGCIEKAGAVKDEITPVSFIWNKPVAGKKAIIVRVNEQKSIIESNLANNEISASFAGEISTILPSYNFV